MNIEDVIFKTKRLPLPKHLHASCLMRYSILNKDIELFNNHRNTNYIYKINGRFFPMFSHFCNIHNVSLENILIKSINNTNKCINCGKELPVFIDRQHICHKIFCCKECQKKYLTQKKEQLLLIKICKICGKEYENKHDKKMLNTCGDSNCLEEAKKQKNQRIKETHWCHKKNANKILEKRVLTRLENDKKYNRKYTAWNKGKTGIYSKETIEKIRAAAIRQMDKGLIHKTKIEYIVEDFLNQLNLNYKYSFILKKRLYDFCLLDYNLIIECDGDYWHGNPLRYPIPSERQKIKQLDDKIKISIAKENGYEIFHFWENDIYNNFNMVKEKINDYIKNYDKTIL